MLNEKFFVPIKETKTTQEFVFPSERKSDHLNCLSIFSQQEQMSEVDEEVLTIANLFFSLYSINF